MRVEQPEGTRGSLKWIQRLVARGSAPLEEPLRQAGALESSATLKWLSPLPSDDWAEYRDAAFLDRIGHPELSAALSGFWPQRGPQWDGLALDSAGTVFLIEAKAHPSEMASSCKAGESSIGLIRASLEVTKRAFAANEQADWLDGYYQYANRLAHLLFLESHCVRARMIFLYFVGDKDMGGPLSVEGWALHIDHVLQHLGLHESPPGVFSLFREIADLQ